jgi:hypothetical protein
MRTTRVAWIAGLLAASTSAHAQIGTGTFRWELSADNGGSWQSELVVQESQTTVRLRAVVSWSQDAGTWFGRASYDVKWSSIGTAGLHDTLITYNRTPGIDQFIQIANGQRQGSVLKIDDQRDTLAPGQGLFGFASVQLIPNFGGNNRSNPIVISTFDIALDGSLGGRQISSVFNPPGNGNPQDQFLSIYINTNGATNRPIMQLFDASLTVIPSPVAFCIIAPGLLVFTRRRC